MPVKAQAVKPCYWVQDSDGLYNTDCGNVFEFNEGTLRENRARFCTFCGRPIEDMPYEDVEPDDGEEGSDGQAST